MDKFLANPAGLIALVCIIGLVIGINVALFSALRQSATDAKQAAIWSKALRGGADIRSRHNEQLNELHQKVQQIQTPSPADEKDDSP